MKINQETKFVVVDCETTGLDPEKDEVVEVAMVTCTMKGIADQKSWLCKPSIPIPPAASAIYHLIDEDVAGCDPFPSKGSQAGMWNGGDAVWAAPNAEFDSKFLRINPVLCTMRLAQKLWPELDAYGNQYLRYRLGLKVPLDRSQPMHRALPDAIVTATLLIYEIETLLSRAKDPDSITSEYLIQWANEPMLLHTV